MTLARIDRNKKYTVVGLGLSGLSCARWLLRQGASLTVLDTRPQPPALPQLRREHPDVQVYCGPLDQNILCRSDLLVVSPGIALKQPAIAAAMAAGVAVCGDIELFCQNADAPVVAITGSNGKSTVTTLLGEMAKQAGLAVAVGGNIGTPALDLLDGPRKDLYVLELSSFQLETTFSLAAQVATVLNVTEDHMDRYDAITDYREAKCRIYRNSRTAVRNRDDPLTAPLTPSPTAVTFGLSPPTSPADFGVLTDGEGACLMHGNHRLLAVADLKVYGPHNVANALAALALGFHAGLPQAAMNNALKTFPGLPHRCQWVREQAGVNWYNDSKATNPGAAIASIESIGSRTDGQIVLVAGGLAKGADFATMRNSVTRHVRAAVILGHDAKSMMSALDGCTAVHRVASLHDAVTLAARLACRGDAVLLAPACASLDMFANYCKRGEAFCRHVGELSG